MMSSGLIAIRRGLLSAFGRSYSLIARLWIQLADVSLQVRGEPKISILVELQTVRSRTRSFRGILFDIASLRIQPSKDISEHSGPPDGAARPRLRIMRTGTQSRGIPF